MGKKETLEKLNRKIDQMILAGKTGTELYKSLLRMHMRLVGRRT